MLKFPEGAFYDLVSFTSRSIKNGKKSAHVHVIDGSAEPVWTYCDKEICQQSCERLAQNKENVHEVVFPVTKKQTGFTVKFAQ